MGSGMYPTKKTQDRREAHVARYYRSLPSTQAEIAARWAKMAATAKAAGCTTLAEAVAWMRAEGYASWNFAGEMLAPHF